MQVALVTVGDELLAGDTQNTNATWLAARLTERGAVVKRILVVPDDVATIATEVEALADDYDAVLVTGGLGPTHDDVTMAGVAAAFDRELDEHPDALAYFESHDGYERGDLAAGTTDLPADSRLLENEVGVAPGAVVENVYVLPGVPTEMEAMFDTIAGAFDGTPMHVETVRIDSPESELVDAIAEVRDQFDVVVGSYPGDGVRVKIQHENPEVVKEAATWFTAQYQ